MPAAPSLPTWQSLRDDSWPPNTLSSHAKFVAQLPPNSKTEPSSSTDGILARYSPRARSNNSRASGPMPPRCLRPLHRSPTARDRGHLPVRREETAYATCIVAGFKVVVPTFRVPLLLRRAKSRKSELVAQMADCVIEIEFRIVTLSPGPQQRGTGATRLIYTLDFSTE